MKTLVTGYGNRSRRDDGVGWTVVERLQSLHLPDTDCVAGHQLEVDLADTLRGYDLVVFVDAAVPQAAAPITRTVVQPVLQSHAVAHYLTPGDVLQLCRALYGDEPRGVLFSIRGETFDFGDELSPSVARAADEVVRQVAQLIWRCQADGPAPLVLAGDAPAAPAHA